MTKPHAVHASFCIVMIGLMACGEVTKRSDADVPCTPDTECRAAAGICDIAEICGSDSRCPPDTFKPADTMCRESIAVCDAAEQCTGSLPDCPVDMPAPATTVCRASGGPCDVADRCDGVSMDCPLDQVLPSGTICKASSGGACDPDDVCTGGKTCPTVTAPAGMLCRGAVNACDVDERCDGTNESCPADAFQNSMTSCGPVPYTGPTETPANCGGANFCMAGLILDCGLYSCSGTAATCTTCSCFCDAP